MYTEIKTIQFDKYEVVIYQDEDKSYFVEYKGCSEKLFCGKDYFKIYDILNVVLPVKVMITGNEILTLVDKAELLIGDESTTERIQNIVKDVIMKDEKLWPKHVQDDVMYVLNFRYGRYGDQIRRKLHSGASIETWLIDAIASGRIYRLSTCCNPEKQRARIISEHPTPNGDYFLNFEILDENNVTEVRSEFFSSCQLTHYVCDELPAQYQQDI